MKVKIEESWWTRLKGEFKSQYFEDLLSFVDEEYRAGKVYPPASDIFAAFAACRFDQIKVVILGQDPYHGPNQAHGLSFSVKKGVPVPPSLRNIYKEIYRDMGIPMPGHGELTSWATQGVLLLNTTLTVRANQALSHQKKGWEIFTDAVIQQISDGRSGVVFMLWGANAQSKTALIDTSRHLILKSTHPSPLSAHRGFLGCGHFSQANNYLKQRGEQEVNWKIDSELGF